MATNQPLSSHKQDVINWKKVQILAKLQLIMSMRQNPKMNRFMRTITSMILMFLLT